MRTEETKVEPKETDSTDTNSSSLEYTTIPTCLPYHPRSELHGREGYYPNITRSQLKAASELRRRLFEAKLKYDADEEDEFLKLLRFLRARKFNVDKAFAMMRDDVLWREQENRLTLRQEKAIEVLNCDLTQIYNFFPTWIQGFDKQLRPVSYRQFGKFETWNVLKLTSMERLIRFHAWETEQALRNMYVQSNQHGYNIETFLLVIDAAGWGLKLATSDAFTFIKGMASTDSDHYPERLGTAIIINAPWVLAGSWKIVQSMLDPVTKAKVRIIGTNQAEWYPVLLEHIDNEQIPRQYGGTAPDPTPEEAIRMMDPESELGVDGDCRHQSGRTLIRQSSNPCIPLTSMMEVPAQSTPEAHSSDIDEEKCSERRSRDEIDNNKYLDRNFQYAAIPTCLPYHPRSELHGREGYYPNITRSQLKAASELRRRLFEAKLKYDVDEEDEFLKLLRFLRARKFNVDKAFAMMRDDVLWREQENRLTLRQKSADDVLGCDLRLVSSYFPTWTQGVDKQCRPVFYGKFGKFETWNLLKYTSVEKLLEFHAWQMERVLWEMIERSKRREGCNIETFLSIIDLAGWNLGLATTAAFRIMMGIATIDSAHYPERLGNIIIINAPIVIYGSWQLIFSSLDDVTKSKIQIMGTSRDQWLPVLMEHIEIDQIPQQYGGTAPDETDGGTHNIFNANQEPSLYLRDEEVPVSLTAAHIYQVQQDHYYGSNPMQPIAGNVLCDQRSVNSSEHRQRRAAREAGLTVDESTQTDPAVFEEILAMEVQAELRKENKRNRKRNKLTSAGCALS